jgi:anti-anti-sigma regulatory factor
VQPRARVAVVIGDMTATAFCDSSGARALLIAQDTAARHQTELRLVVPRAIVLRGLHVVAWTRSCVCTRHASRPSIDDAPASPGQQI